MTYYHPEPTHRHDQAARIGVLLVNLGTPEAPTAQALRPYLKEFLWDRRVVEIPRPVWWLILNGIILNTRPRKSAEKYAAIWTPDGSPLKVHTERQAKLLKGWLGEAQGQGIDVVWAMRYGAPSVESRILEMKARGVDRLLVVPLYPQYAASSTGSALDAVWTTLARLRNPPELRVLRSFPDDSGYIAALKGHIEDQWRQYGRPEVLVMSFHGVPRFTLDKGDPYFCECHKTGRLLAEALGLTAEQYRITFQSRFGRAEWLQPYTAPTLEALGKAKTRRVDVICPGFVGDCLETLEEIAMEGKASFLSAGGGEFRYLPALNENQAWIEALSSLVSTHLQGWLSTPGAPAKDLAVSLQRARALGAQN